MYPDLYDILFRAVVVVVEFQVFKELLHLGLSQWHCTTGLVGLGHIRLSKVMLC